MTYFNNIQSYQNYNQNNMQYLNNRHNQNKLIERINDVLISNKDYNSYIGNKNNKFDTIDNLNIKSDFNYNGINNKKYNFYNNLKIKNNDINGINKNLLTKSGDNIMNNYKNIKMENINKLKGGVSLPKIFSNIDYNNAKEKFNKKQEYLDPNSAFMANCNDINFEKVNIYKNSKVSQNVLDELYLHFKLYDNILNLYDVSMFIHFKIIIK